MHLQSRKFAVIVVGDPATKTLKAFRLKGLPFGSVKSVLLESGTQHLDNPDHHVSDNCNKFVLMTSYLLQRK